MKAQSARVVGPSAFAAPTQPGLPFRDRPPTAAEFERLRLALSSYRDGSGQLTFGGRTYPGWRDFERAAAAVLGGTCPEDKGLFDVEVPGPTDTSLPYGLSCKTSKLEPAGSQVLMEMSNASAKFWTRLNGLGIDPTKEAHAAGVQIVRLVEEWHDVMRSSVDVPSSSYVVLTHDKSHQLWRLFWFGLAFRDPSRLDWTYDARRIFAMSDGIRLWEWYGWSGGQLKYYPTVAEARWASGFFELLDPPIESPAARAERYWPQGGR